MKQTPRDKALDWASNLVEVYVADGYFDGKPDTRFLKRFIQDLTFLIEDIEAAAAREAQPRKSKKAVAI